MKRPLLLSFVFALAATAAVWGLWLSPRWSLSPSLQEVTVNPRCRVTGADLRCGAPYSPRWSVDAGAADWQELPADAFLREAARRGEPAPAWNPYVGSGFPIVFDGVNSRWSPTRALLRRLPGEQGRDVLLFLRLFVWTWGITLAVALIAAAPPAAGIAAPETAAGIPAGAIVGMAALAATLAPYPAGYLDIIFLDVDLLAPWFLVLVLAFSLGRLRLAAAAGGAAALGLLVGLLGFLQSQFVFAAAAAVLALAAARTTRGRSLLLAAAAAAGLLLAAPTYLPLVGNLPQLTSIRDVTCIAEEGIGWRRLAAQLFTPPIAEAGTDFLAGGVGLLLMAATWRRWPRRFPLYALLLLAAWAVLGLPHAVCSLPGISGVRFRRHLVPYVEVLFVFGVAAALQALARQLAAGDEPETGQGAVRRHQLAGLATLAVLGALPVALHAPGRWRGLLLAAALAGGGLLLAALVPFGALRGVTGGGSRRRALLLTLGLGLCAYPSFAFASPYLRGLLWWGPGRQLALPPATLDRRTPLGGVAELSRRQDRRHYGVGHVLFPNWPAAFGILDLRMMGPLYAAGVHTLDSGLFHHWLSDNAAFPDRLVRPDPERLMWTPEFQRVLIVNRVSLLSFPTYFVRFPPPPSPYQRDRCRPIGRAEGIESWLCPGVGAVGWFPRRVEGAGSIAAALSRLAAAAPAELADLAVVGPEGVHGDLAAAAGRVLAVARRGDDLAYRLEVERPGIFVLSDAWFPGWRAWIDGVPAPLLRADVAFKAVRVPRGRVELKLRFEPRWSSPPPPP